VQQHLGAGTFGSVFKGLWERPDGSALPVALKKVFILEKEVGFRIFFIDNELLKNHYIMNYDGKNEI
jgi:hypothetical protein